MSCRWRGRSWWRCRNDDRCALIRIGLGRVESNPAIWEAIAATGIVVVGWVVLNLNPHPFEAEGAAPNCRFARMTSQITMALPESSGVVKVSSAPGGGAFFAGVGHAD